MKKILTKKVIIIFITIFSLVTVVSVGVIRNINQYYFYYITQFYDADDYYQILNTDLQNKHSKNLMKTDAFEVLPVESGQANKEIKFNAKDNDFLKDITLTTFAPYYPGLFSRDDFYFAYGPENAEYLLHVTPDNKLSVSGANSGDISKEKLNAAKKLFKTQAQDYIAQQSKFVGEPHPWFNLQWLFNATH